MKKFFTIFFVTLGVIFFGLLTCVAYLWVADPWGIKPFIMSNGSASSMQSTNTPFTGKEAGVGANLDTTTTTSDPNDKNPNLNSSQEDALKLIGIDPAALPTSITPKQEVCFTEKLGIERVTAIKAGATPEVVELFKAKECLAL